MSALAFRSSLWPVIVRKTDRESLWAKLARPFRRKKRMAATDDNRRAGEAEPDKDEMFHKLVDITTYQGPYGP